MTTDYKPKVSEHQEQSVFFDWLHFAYLHTNPEVHPLFFAVPNGVHIAGSDKVRAMKMNKLKKEGFTPGVADTEFLSARGGYFGIVMEFKTTDRRNEQDGGLTEGQAEFLEAARLEGFKSVVAYGADEAQQYVEEYMNMPRTQDMIYNALKFLEQGNPEGAKLLLKEVTRAWDE